MFASRLQLLTPSAAQIRCYEQMNDEMTGYSRVLPSVWLHLEYREKKVEKINKKNVLDY